MWSNIKQVNEKLVKEGVERASELWKLGNLQKEQLAKIDELTKALAEKDKQIATEKKQLDDQLSKVKGSSTAEVANLTKQLKEMQATVRGS